MKDNNAYIYTVADGYLQYSIIVLCKCQLLPLSDRKKIKTLTVIVNLFILVPRTGIAEPRQENSPPDYFLILLFDSLLISKKKKRN